jgi:hypothetical protein
MRIPPFLAGLLQLLFDLAVPGAICTLALAGLALRQEGGVNFELGGRFQRWMLWTVIFLTLPQFLSWFAAQGINLPPQTGAVTSPWLASMERTLTAFISQVVVARIIPVLAAFFVLKATLDSASGHSPLGSVIAAIFLLSISGTVALIQGMNSGGTLATADMLASLWSFLAGTVLPEAAGLAVVGAVVNYSRQRPFARLVFTALAFLSVSGIWQLVQAMVNN